ncbi:MAG: amylo-alpha-1,6-glucosidase, partial [Bacteroidota bacterium]
GESREIAYTNKQAGVFYTETSGEHRNSWQGWTISAKKMLHDYAVFLDRRLLRRSETTEAVVYPHQLIRKYDGGLEEIVTLLDSLDALIVEFHNVTAESVRLAPLFLDAMRSDVYEVTSQDSVLLIARKNHLRRSGKENYPVWVGVASHEDISVLEEDLMVPTLSGFSPASVEAKVKDEKVRFIIVVGDTKEEVAALARHVRFNSERLKEVKKNRLENLLRYSRVRTSDDRLNAALMWAKVSLDALIMNQMGKGIFAGLPWFNNYWGRDTFISLPGATLVTGNFKEAREILLSFSSLQETNPQSPNYGRIPNLVTTESTSYNTADGTPWFIRELYEYVKYSNDTLIVRELYPVVKRSIQGTLRHHVDEHYFLVHGDAETWMDAVGPDGPWSPRGNRAAEVQVLWYFQLLIGSFIATYVGDLDAAEEWGSIASSVNVNFNEMFLEQVTGEVYDHLNPDGTPDRQVRPNQIFCLDIVNSEAVRQKLITTVVSQLTYPHGVASLSQNDEDFHPYHHYQPFYVQDAAYHNGVVWTWLSGQVIYGMTRYDLQEKAYRLTENLIDQILDYGGVGTISELLDTAPRPDEKRPRRSGTFSQAWSLAEFIRNIYQDYFGVMPDATGDILFLSPRLPKSIEEVEFLQHVGTASVSIHYLVAGDRVRVTLSSAELERELTVHFFWPLENGDAWRARLKLRPGKTLRIVFDAKRFSLFEDQEQISSRPMYLTNYSLRNHFADLRFAQPMVNEGLRALKGPDHTVLQLEDVRQQNANAKIIYNAIDEKDDDHGTGNYRYPKNPHFAEGILDITKFQVTADRRNVYFKMQFRNLVNPGWHPEYGFQLTYVTIAIDKDGMENSGNRQIGANSNFLLDPRFAYEMAVYVGGGLRVVDAAGKIVAEYFPGEGDSRDPIGDVSTRTISFSIPIKHIGIPDERWQFSVLVGAQDDHGGAGLGEFRNVVRRADEWAGGGKMNPHDANVYDTILPR